MSTTTPTSRHITGSALVVDPERMVVLLVKHLLTGFWQAPGGHTDPDETPHETAVRETLEETGVEIQLWSVASLTIPGATWLPQPLMVCEFPAPADPAWNEPAHHHVDYLYLATADSLAPLTPQTNEVDGVRWWPFDQLGTREVRPDVPIAWECALDLIQLVTKGDQP